MLIMDLLKALLGAESGGHGASSAPSLLNFITDVLALPCMQRPTSPLLLGAGGMAIGDHIAAVLALGASGAVLGTRFLLTPESLYSNAQKQVLVSATSTDTIRTMAFDNARGTLGWPQGIDGRAIRNSAVLRKLRHLIW